MKCPNAEMVLNLLNHGDHIPRVHRIKSNHTADQQLVLIHKGEERVEGEDKHWIGTCEAPV